MSIRRRRRSENFYSGLNAVAASVDSGYEVYAATGSRLFLPAATNYCTNPSFEASTNGAADGWSFAATDVIGTVLKERVAKLVGSGSYAQRIQYTGVGGDADGGRAIYFGFLSAGTFSENDVCTLSFTAKGSSSGVSILGQVRKQDGSSTTSVNVSATLSDTPTRFSISKTMPAGTTGVQIYITISGIGTGDAADITIDDLLIEKSSVLTPYFSGSTSDSLNVSTYAWSGATDASTSTRDASVLAIPSPWATVPSAGTIAGRGIPLGANTAYTTEVLTGLYDGATLRTGLNHKAGKRNMYVTAESTSAAAFTAGTVNSSIGRWNAAGTYLHFNGTAATDGAAPTTGGALTHVKIGVSGAYYLGPKLYLARCLSATEAVTLDGILRGTVDDNTLMTLKNDWLRSGDFMFTGRQRDGSQLFVKG